MAFRLELVNPLECREWNELLATSPNSSFFHTSNWARVLFESYGYRPRYFLARNGAIATLVPLMEVRSFLTGQRGVSLPFTDYSMPILGEGVDINQVMGPIIEHGTAAGWRHVEIRDPASFPEDVPIFSMYYGHVVDLSGTAEALQRRLRDSTKRNIRKAAKEGVAVRRAETIESVREFYRLNCMTRRDHGLPPQPFRFFLKIFEHVISKGFGHVFVAYFKGIPVAANVYFHYGEKAVYKYGASDKAFQHLRANNLVMWEAMRWYAGNGAKSLCLGRTEPENEGLMQFKAGWGAAERPIKYYRYDLKAKAYVRGKAYGPAFYNKVFNAMPIFLLEAVGEVLYRHMG